VVGGASLSGGKGSAINAMLGAILIVLISAGGSRQLHFRPELRVDHHRLRDRDCVVLDQLNARLTAKRLVKGTA